MAEISARDWLDWHSSRAAQDHAVRLSVACSAVIPSDRMFQRLIDEQITSDVIGFAIHGRRAMERHGDKSASLNHDPLWPVSSVSVPVGLSLWDAFGVVVHAKEITVEWEPVDLDPNPYKGRVVRFAGSVCVKSEEKKARLPIVHGRFFLRWFSEQADLVERGTVEWPFSSTRTPR